MENEILQYLSQYAYQPWLVYSLIIAILTASSFGLPFPEELTLISTGLLVYMGMNPEKYPPPTPDAESLNIYVASVVCFLAVFLSDFLVFMLGRIFGSKFLDMPFSKRLIGEKNLHRVLDFASRHGTIAAGVFRFTPALRFPGHFSCGMLGVSPFKFCLIDGTAALLTVPTQVWIIATYGEWILDHIKTFKVYLFAAIALGILFYWIRNRRNKSKPAAEVINLDARRVDSKLNRNGSES